MADAATKTKEQLEDAAGVGDADDSVDFEVIEEGSPEAKALLKKQEGGEEEDDEEDERLGRHASDDRQIVGGEDDEEGRKAKTDKRRRQRKRLREKLDEKDNIIDSLRQQLGRTSERLNGVEKRTGANEIAMLDKAITDTSSALEIAKQNHSMSLTQNDPALVTEAMTKLYETGRQLESLQNLKSTVLQNARRAPTLDPSTSQNVNSWMARNSWFRPESGDEDSLIAKMLDSKVASDGYDPATPAYWQELDRRVAKRLPHRVRGKGNRREEEDDDEDDFEDVRSARKNKRDQEDDLPPPPRSNVSGSGSGAAPGKVKIVLSAERVKTMKDAGIWDDPAQRSKMVKEYQKYDRENAASTRR